MNKLVLPGIASVALTLATASIIHRYPQRVLTEPPMAPPRVAFTERVAAVGLVEASSENISLGSHLPGVVEKVFVTTGQDVKANDPLVRLDTRALEASLAERRGNLAVREAAVQTALARVRTARAALAEVQRNLRFAEAVSDTRSISAEEVTRRRSAVEIAEAEVQTAEAEVTAAESAVIAAEAAVKSVEIDLARSVVTAPIDGRVLQLRVRPGEYVAAGPAVQPWLVLGQVRPLHVRVDVDEHEAWRVHPGARVIAQVRGNAALSTLLTFVRFEPMVVPKQSLTGASTERVDTRVMQVLYQVEGDDLPLFVGQQMDVFIEAHNLQNAISENSRLP